MPRVWCILSILVALSYSAFASGVKQCYYCNDCGPDPYNTTAAHKETCSPKVLSTNSLFKVNNVEASDDVEWVCGKGKLSKDNKEVVQRGCAPKKIDGKDTCDALKDQAKIQGVNLEFCETCTADLCNSSNVLVSSLVILMAAFFFRYML